MPHSFCDLLCYRANVMFLISLMPGLSFASFVFLFVLGILQYNIYYRTGYRRSWCLSLFCFFASVFALEPFVAQSRAFSPFLTHIYVMFSTGCFCLSSVFYIRSLHYFVAIPRRLGQVVQVACGILSIVAFLAIPVYLFLGKSFFFESGNFFETDNYFSNSYSNRIGTPLILLTVILAASSLLNSFAALCILRIVLKSSQDIFFIVGLLLTVLASLFENILLPFTTQFFFPLIFLSNLFEAFRMHSLSVDEYVREITQTALQDETLSDPTPEKYQNSNLSEGRLFELADKIAQVFERDKIYLNPNLNSEQLAKAIGIPTYQLSQVVNIGLQTTFFDLLSRYRIEEVKKRLASEESSDETILNIAIESGFNSKSSFNSAFKKITGMTPSTYRKLIYNQESS